MVVTCKKCETCYEDAKYQICPRCQQEYDYELGLQVSRENKAMREKID